MPIRVCARPAKRRKPRPSRGRGLRVSTGCLVCRARRIKCDEGRPKCHKCVRSGRECNYATTLTPSTERTLPTPAEFTPPVDLDRNHDSAVVSDLISGNCQVPAGNCDKVVDVAVSSQPVPVTPVIDPVLCSTPVGQHEPWPFSATPFQWFDLLAQDAISTIQRQHDRSNGSLGWHFDVSSLSRRQNPTLDEQGGLSHTESSFGDKTNPFIATVGSGLEAYLEDAPESGVPSWNSTSPIAISAEDNVYFQYYIQVIGPMLDLFDRERHFTNVVPHLALHNVGLLKSILAVAARRMGLASRPQDPIPTSPESTRSGSLSDNVASKYYYETLQYLSKALSFRPYLESYEILATAIMINTYEMFGFTNSTSNSDWDRHLRGAFWILRRQDNDGESVDGLRRAVWWAWLRQDLWAAFCAKRPTLTIWSPSKRLEDLQPHQYATRIFYIAAKIVQFSSTDATALADIERRINLGQKLLRDLQAWEENIPTSFRPIAISKTTNNQSTDGDSMYFEPIWIHPPSHAGAIQIFNFARIILLIHMPVIGGLEAYGVRQKLLEKSLNTIGGIASQEVNNEHLASINIQALYAAGLCVQASAAKAAVIQLLQRIMDASRFPAAGILKSLQEYWDSSAS